jgi:hypothetical protein
MVPATQATPTLMNDIKGMEKIHRFSRCLFAKCTCNCAHPKTFSTPPLQISAGTFLYPTAFSLRRRVGAEKVLQSWEGIRGKLERCEC